MNPTLAAAYSRAMRSALSGSGYAGAESRLSRSTSGLATKARSKKPLFDFTANDRPDVPIDLVREVFQRIRSQDWSGVFLMLALVLVPSGFAVFVLRDRYYRRRGGETIQLTLE